MRQRRLQLSASMEYERVRTEPSVMTALKPEACGPPKRTDQKVAPLLGCMASGWGTASPKRTWSWSQPELFHGSLSPPAEPRTVWWHCFSPTRTVLDSPSLTSLNRRVCSTGALAALLELGLNHWRTSMPRR